LPVKINPSFWEQTWTYKKGVHKDLKAAILAAGLGQRMAPLTAGHLPKPLLPLGGKVPMVELWVRKLVQSGITDISMNLCVLREAIKKHFKDGAKFVASMNYIEEELPSGTLGGICKQVLGIDAKRFLSEKTYPTTPPFKGSTVIAPSGDIVTDFGAELLEEMYDIHRKAGAALTMVLVPVPWERRKDFGTVVLDKPENRENIISKSGKIKEFVEKDPNSPSNLNNASIYLIEMELLKALDGLRTESSLNVSNPFYDFGKHAIPALLGLLPGVSINKNFPLWGIQYDGNWFDVGQKRDYLKVNECILDGKIEILLPYEKLPWGYLGIDVSIDFSKVNIIPPVIIGNNCIIEPGVTLGPYTIIGDGWSIQKQAHLQHSVLWERYPYFDDNGYGIAPEARKQFDRNEVRSEITIEHSIIVEGYIQRDIREQTVDVDVNGELRILPIDYVPDVPRL
jgi:mannose-1-phosphate guanylyltransferase/phosphomannomutase